MLDLGLMVDVIMVMMLVIWMMIWVPYFRIVLLFGIVLVDLDWDTFCLTCWGVKQKIK